jgi:hypothetical protein
MDALLWTTWMSYTQIIVLAKDSRQQAAKFAPPDSSILCHIGGIWALGGTGNWRVAAQ